MHVLTVYSDGCQKKRRLFAAPIPFADACRIYITIYTINGVLLNTNTTMASWPPLDIGHWTLESKAQSSLGSDADAHCTAQL